MVLVIAQYVHTWMLCINYEIIVVVYYVVC